MFSSRSTTEKFLSEKEPSRLEFFKELLEKMKRGELNLETVLEDMTFEDVWRFIQGGE